MSEFLLYDEIINDLLNDKIRKQLTIKEINNLYNQLFEFDFDQIISHLSNIQNKKLQLIYMVNNRKD